MIWILFVGVAVVILVSQILSLVTLVKKRSYWRMIHPIVILLILVTISTHGIIAITTHRLLTKTMAGMIIVGVPYFFWQKDSKPAIYNLIALITIIFDAFILHPFV